MCKELRRQSTNTFRSSHVTTKILTLSSRSCFMACSDGHPMVKELLSCHSATVVCNCYLVGVDKNRAMCSIRVVGIFYQFLLKQYEAVRPDVRRAHAIAPSRPETERVRNHQALLFLVSQEWPFMCRPSLLDNRCHFEKCCLLRRWQPHMGELRTLNFDFGGQRFHGPTFLGGLGK